MKMLKIPQEDGSGFTLAFVGENLEMINPYLYFYDLTYNAKYTLTKEAIPESQLIEMNVSESLLIDMAHKQFWELLAEIRRSYLPGNLIKLLSANSKKEQVKLLKGCYMEGHTLSALSLYAYDKFQMKFSMYRFEIDPPGFDANNAPILIHVDKDKKVHKVGPTSLSNGQMKNLVFQRKVIIAKFIGDEITWHCFFLTYASVRREERWENGQPHYHYFSDKWNISKSEVLARMEAGNYPTTEVHVALKDERFGG